MRSSRRLRSIAALGAATSVVASTSQAAIVYSPPPKKSCVGLNGGGWHLGMGLNEGWEPSRLVLGRVRIYNPKGMLVFTYRQTFTDGGWGVYFTPRRVGTYTTVYATWIARPYLARAPMDDRQRAYYRANVWQTSPEKSRVYRCP